MKNLNSREQLQDLLLSKYFIRVQSNSNLMNQLLTELNEKYGLSRSRTSRILSHTIAIQDVSDIELYIITDFLYENLLDRDEKIKELNVAKYYTEHETRQIKEGNIRLDKEKLSTDNIVTFKNVLQVNEEEYICVASIKELNNIHNSGNYEYLWNSGRENTRKVRSGKLITMANIDDKKVEEIVEVIQQNKPMNEVLSFGVIANGEEKFQYKNNTIIIEIDKESRLCILDGNNRWISLNKAISLNEEIEYNFICKIYHMSFERCLEFVSIQNRQTPFKRVKLDTLATTDKYSMITKNINNYGNLETNSFFHRIGEDGYDIQYKNAITISGIVIEAIRFNFEKDDIKAFELKIIQDFLQDSLEYVYQVYNQYWNTDRKKTKLETIVLDNNFFVGVIAILKELYTDKLWRSKIIEIFSSINISRNNNYWNEIGFNNSRTGKKQLKSISEGFVKLIK